MNKIYKLFIFLSVSVISSVANGQGISNYNLYSINTYAINPAYVGSKDGLFTSVHFKNHLAGISEAPRNLMFAAHSPISKKLGLGGNVVVGQGGLYKSTSANIASSYNINIASEHRVAFGLSGGFVKQSLDMNKLQGADLSDPTLADSYNDKVFYKFGFGATYNWDDLEVSVAFPNLKQEERNLLSRYFMGYASYQIYTKDKQWRIQPSLLYKSIPVSPEQLDINVMAEWHKLLWTQVGYRTNNNLIMAGGVTIESLNLGYAYEAPLGKAKPLSKGTHEVVVTFLIRTKPKPVLPAADSENSKEFPTYSDSTLMHIKDLESQVAKLKGEVGEISHYIAMDSVRHTRDTIYSYGENGKHIKLKPGNYIVVQTCRTKEFAHKLEKMYDGKGIPTYIVYNETQTLFYIVEKEFADFEQARYEKEKLEKKGYKNVWVMVY